MPMAKQSTAKKRLKKLAHAIPSVTETHTIMLALESKQHAFGDYAIAIIGAGLIEKALEAIILGRFVNLSPDERNSIFNHENNGPLGDLSAKIKVAYALGLFGQKTREDLEHIRVIRNSFAHSLNLLRFETEEVAELCQLLHIPSTIKFADRLLLAVANMDTLADAT
jgi:hypothetical protein